VFEKIPVFLCRHGSGKTACNRPDARAKPFERGLNMETREVRYGKAVEQFTVWTLYDSVRTPPREIQISGDLGFISLYIEASRHVFFTEFGSEFFCTKRGCLGRDSNMC
jgi:hypothetical protein